MRIGLLTSVGRTLDAFFLDAVATWSEAGHDVHCAAGTAPEAAAFNFHRIEGLTQRPAPSNVFVPLRLRAWARDRDLDVVVSNTATASTLARLSPMPCPLVYFCHGLHWNGGRHPAQIVESALAGRASSVVTINSDDYAWFATRHPHVLHLREGVGVPHSYPWSALPPEDGLRLCWAGDFVHRKRPELAVTVLSHLLRDRPGAHLTMLGDGPLVADVRQLAHDLGVEDSVTFAGRTDVRPHIAGSHAILHTATWEGLPRILLEGAAMGRTAYAFDVKGVRDVPHVRTVADGDTETLAALIRDAPPRSALDPAVGETMRADAVASKMLLHLEAVVG